MAAVSPLLESNYTHRLTLLQVLTKVSPQIEPFIEGNFANYLGAHFLATNSPDLAAAVNAKLGVLSVSFQRKLIKEFSEESLDLSLDSFSYLPLFKLLIGPKLSELINESGTIYNADSSGGLLRIDGLPFHYKRPNQNDRVYEKFSIKEAKVNPFFKSILNTIQSDNHAEQLIFYELEQDIKKASIKPFRKKKIIRQNLLYSRKSNGKITFSKFSHSKNDKSAFSNLLEEIFINSGESKVGEIKNMKLEKWFQTIQNNYSKCRLDNLLETHCRLPKVLKKYNLKNLLKMHTTFKDLFRFIYAVYTVIFPVKTFGSRENRRIFFENIKVLFTSSLAVSFRFFDILNGIDVEKMRPLFDDLPFYEANDKVEARFLYWIFERIKEIVKSKFYITEGDHTHKYSLLFYRYDLWERIRIRGIQQLFQKNQWEVLVKNIKGNELCMSMSDYLKFSEIRLIPKKSCLRPILSLKFHRDSNSSKGEYKHIQRICLQLLKRVTKYSVFDSHSGSARKIHEQIIQLKDCDKSVGGSGLYVVRGDFENCYPSMNIIKLLISIMQMKPFTISLPHERKLLIELIEIVIEKGSFYRKRSDFLIKPVLAKFMSKSQSLFNRSDFSRLKELISKQLLITSFDKHIFSSVKSKSLDFTLLFKIFKKYFSKETEFRIGKKKIYRMTKGVRQGTTLASELCEIYLNQFLHHIFHDRLHIEPVVNSSHFFLRVADDFIFVTRDLQMAKDFSTIICEDYSVEWGLSINRSKFTTNFDLETGELDHCSKISFFGRKISTRDLSISLDISSYQSLRIADTYNSNPFAPVLSIMRANINSLHFFIWPEVVDQRVCSLDQIVVNLFERFLLQAFRFVSFLCVSRTWRKCHDKLGVHICLLIYQMSIRMSQIITKWKSKIPALQFPLSRLQLQYIAASAFQMLYKKGPHKVQCRVGERKTIITYCQLLCQQNANRFKGGRIISLPTRIYFPFNEIIV